MHKINAWRGRGIGIDSCVYYDAANGGELLAICESVEFAEKMVKAINTANESKEVSD